MSIFKESLWSDGQALDHGDANNMSRWLRSQVFDTLGASCRGISEVLNPTGAEAMGMLWCFGSAAYVFPNSGGNLIVDNFAGPIMQILNSGTVNGNDPAFVAYYVAANELQTTLNAADGANPRWDLICVKLDYVEDTSVTRDFENAAGVQSSQSFNSSRSVRITKQYVVGTPAGSPVEPAVPSGYVKWCAIKVPAAATNLLTVTSADGNAIRDYRMPLGLEAYTVPADLAYGHADWTKDSITYGKTIQSASLRSLSFFPLAGLASHARLVRVALAERHSSGGTTRVVDVVRTEMKTAIALDSVRDLSSDLLGPAVTNNYQMSISPGSNNNAPIWANGYSSPYGPGSGVEAASTRVGLRFMSGGDNAVADTLQFARFWFAGG
jgi:hypothetical protein